MKDFVKNIAFAIDGVKANDDDDEEAGASANAAQSAVRQYWKDFTAGWQIENSQIHPKITRSVTMVRLPYHFFTLFFSHLVPRDADYR